jgi:hypothetical protein
MFLKMFFLPEELFWKRRRKACSLESNNSIDISDTQTADFNLHRYILEGLFGGRQGGW